MTVNKKATTPREGLHRAVCPLPEQCRYQAGMSAQSARCFALDAVLDLNDEWVLHEAAHDLKAGWEAMPTRTRNTLGPGVLHALDVIDPFVKIDAFTDDPETHVHPGESRPDCRGCVKGVEHYHRKSDGSPVTVPVDLREGD